MPTYACTIAGVSKQITDGWSLREIINGRNTIRFEVLSADGSYRPAKHDEVILTEDGTRIFGGNIDQPSETGTAGHGGTAMRTACSAVDFNALADRRILTGVIPAGPLKAALQQVDDFLAPYGVTLDAGQVTGPNLPDMTFGYTRLDQIFNQFSVLSSGYVWEVDYNKTLRMFLPGTVAAPFNLVDGDGNAIDDITIAPSRVDYANKVFVIGAGDMPYVAIASDGGPDSLLVEAAITYSNVLDAAMIDALAIEELARHLLQPRIATYTTRRTGLKPGMTQTLTVPSHSISGVTFTITEIETRGEDADYVTRTVTLIEGTLAGGDWRDVFTRWAGGGTGTGTTIVGGGGPAVTLGTVPLGGSRDRGKNPNPAAWVPVVDWVPYTAPATYNGKVRAQLRASSGSVTVRLYNVTTSSVVATSGAITSTTETDITPFTVGLTANNLYRLEMTNSINGATVHAIGTLERQ
jgi:hypothetical protein